MTNQTLEYSRSKSWIHSLIALLTPGALIIVNGAERECLRKRLYRNGIYARVATNPGRGCVVKMEKST